MKLVVGLGNPGAKYAGTRHNIGFDVIEELAERFHSPLTEAKHKGIYTIVRKGTEKAILLKPLTYMNLSGESIGEVMRYYDIATDDVVVIYDDLDLPAGRIRLRQKGSAGGHNGIKSTISHLGTPNFNRIRIGIDRPVPPMKVVDYVLGRFTEDEQQKMKQAVAKSADAVEAWLEKPFLEVMNEYNIQT
ncbi:aminoacyl-tRNA hydrolase [Bacillus badius]|uniref:Peptidyl-tRNA hydrolase n=1 Tax=Bacillus badius TaxID=1455 RepID=A0ABR5APJ4_BACBA|nr:aminoacyl-tRNA hydrolase [Bacillus badius]KIL72006.1 Peptidyl-tRNA hydrolase [Bacillus badius]KIL75762.1 Peptidyl-tRNA hydrolase [Bacillus badius]KZO00964.1 aminoacyl-tRNA hydrolase [Bacillus badius]KZR56702.1 aminoacyl-tRNA hydrolase [Bacillus badius]MED4714913.1 aminoacyl-tRNA hydrolase [Bacillus badius]